MKLLYMFCVLKFNDYIIKIRRNNFNSNQTAELKIVCKRLVRWTSPFFSAAEGFFNAY